MRLALVFALCASPLAAPYAHAAPTAAAQPAQRYSTVKGTDGAHWVDRSKLPSNKADRIAVLKQAMEHEITGAHAFHGDADTPAFEIVSHGPRLVEETRGNGTLSLVASEHDAAVYSVKASELQNGVLKTTLLLPVSGHVGLSQAQHYARTNVFEVKVNGVLTKVPARGFVTEQEMSLALKPGRNTITAEPYTNALGGYEEGRTIYIDVK